MFSIKKSRAKLPLTGQKTYKHYLKKINEIYIFINLTKNFYLI